MTRVRVVVPARNEAKRIAAMLRSVGSDFERVVVTDRCTDATADIARACGARVIECPAPGGKVEALRAGMAAEVDIHVCIDADVVVGPRTLRDLVAALRTTPHALASTPPFAPEPLRHWTPLAWALHRYNARNGFSSERLWLSGRCYAVRQVRFPSVDEMRARGFDGPLWADDVWLSRALLARHPHAILRVDTDPVRYLPPRTLRGMSRVYRRLRRELTRMDELFPELPGPGRDRRIDALHGFRDRLALAIFDAALRLVKCHARVANDREPWPVVAESKG